MFFDDFQSLSEIDTIDIGVDIDQVSNKIEAFFMIGTILQTAMQNWICCSNL